MFKIYHAVRKIVDMVGSVILKLAADFEAPETLWKIPQLTPTDLQN